MRYQGLTRRRYPAAGIHLSASADTQSAAAAASSGGPSTTTSSSTPRSASGRTSLTLRSRSATASRSSARSRPLAAPREVKAVPAVAPCDYAAQRPVAVSSEDDRNAPVHEGFWVDSHGIETD